jgi:hypothetical protein
MKKKAGNVLSIREDSYWRMKMDIISQTRDITPKKNYGIIRKSPMDGREF